MTATEELRRLLDERGVSYGGSDSVVYFEDVRGYRVSAYDAPRRYGEGILCVSHTASTEQAVAATLGRGTCRIDVFDNLMESEGMGDVWLECSSCHWKMDYAEAPSMPLNYCPNCGRKVEK